MANVVGHELRKFRFEKGISQKEMAEKIGYKPSYLSVIETSNRPVPNDFLKRILEHYNLTTEQLSDLKNSAEKLKPKVSIKLSSFKEDNRSFCLAFTEKIDDLNQEDRNLILSILKKY